MKTRPITSWHVEAKETKVAKSVDEPAPSNKRFGRIYNILELLEKTFFTNLVSWAANKKLWSVNEGWRTEITSHSQIGSCTWFDPHPGTPAICKLATFSPFSSPLMQPTCLIQTTGHIIAAVYLQFLSCPFYHLSWRSMQPYYPSLQHKVLNRNRKGLQKNLFHFTQRTFS